MKRLKISGILSLLFNSGDTVPLAAARRCSNLVKEISRVVM